MKSQDAILSIRRHYARPPAELVSRFRDLPTGVIVDAMGRHGALDARIRPVTRAHRFVGVALTVWTVPRDNLAPYAALNFARSGDVLMVTNGGCMDASVFGDLALGMARNRPLGAFVTDGLVRDADGLDKLDLPVFAQGLSPNSPFKNGPGDIGGTIAIGGIAVTAGDIVIGDRDGIAVVPRAKAEAVLEAAEAIIAKEAAIEADVRDGMVVPPWLVATLATGAVRYLD